MTPITIQIHPTEPSSSIGSIGGAFGSVGPPVVVAVAGSGCASIQSKMEIISSGFKSGKADIAVGDHLETSAAYGSAATALCQLFTHLMMLPSFAPPAAHLSRTWNNFGPVLFLWVW